MRRMVLFVPELTGYASIRHIAVSLPYAAQLIDGVKYMLPPDVKPPEGDTERRRQRAPRAPSIRQHKRDAMGQSGDNLARCVHQTEIRMKATATTLITMVAIPTTSMVKVRFGLNGICHHVGGNRTAALIWITTAVHVLRRLPNDLFRTVSTTSTF
jgi:hypothetical protein